MSFSIGVRARGWGSAAILSGNNYIAKFFGQQAAIKNLKNNFIVFIK